MRRRHFLTATAATLAAPAIGRTQSRSVLKFIPQADLALLDPIQTTAQVTRYHAAMVFDTLYGVDEDWRPQPQMVEGHVVENDGKTWNLTLRDGLAFHDGSKVLARDAVASIQRWGKRDAFASALMAAVDEISAPTDKLIRFRLKKPFPLLPDALGKVVSNLAVIMPERLAATDPFVEVTEMIGSGPFRFIADERVAGSLAVYERFAGYVPRPIGAASLTAGPKIAYFDRIEWHTIPDAATAAAALQTGEMDWWEQPSTDFWPVLRADAKLTVRILDSTGVICMPRFNFLNPPYDNPAIRRTALAAISQADVMTAVAGTDRTMWRDRVGFFLPGSPMASDAGLDAVSGPPDLKKCRHLLKESGYASEKLVFLVPTDFPSLNAQGLVVADAWGKIGFSVDLQMMDWGSLVKRLSSQQPVDKGGWNAFTNSGTGVQMLNPASHVALRGNGKGAFYGWPEIPQLETLRNAWFEAPNIAAQKDICRQMQLVAFETVPYMPAGQFYQPTAYRNNLTGMLHGAVLFYNLRRV